MNRRWLLALVMGALFMTSCRGLGGFLRGLATVARVAVVAARVVAPVILASRARAAPPPVAPSPECSAPDAPPACFPDALHPDHEGAPEPTAAEGLLPAAPPPIVAAE